MMHLWDTIRQRLIGILSTASNHPGISMVYAGFRLTENLSSDLWRATLCRPLKVSIGWKKSKHKPLMSFITMSHTITLAGHGPPLKPYIGFIILKNCLLSPTVLQIPCAKCQANYSTFFYLVSWVWCCLSKGLYSIITVIMNIIATSHRGLFKFKL